MCRNPWVLLSSVVIIFFLLIVLVATGLYYQDRYDYHYHHMVHMQESARKWIQNRCSLRPEENLEDYEPDDVKDLMAKCEKKKHLLTMTTPARYASRMALPIDIEGIVSMSTAKLLSLCAGVGLVAIIIGLLSIYHHDINKLLLPADLFSGANQNKKRD